MEMQRPRPRSLSRYVRLLQHHFRKYDVIEQGVGFDRRLCGMFDGPLVLRRSMWNWSFRGEAHGGDHDARRVLMCANLGTCKTTFCTFETRCESQGCL